MATGRAQGGRRWLQTLAAAGQSDTDTRAGAITICDGLIVDFLLYGEARRPKDIARQAAAALTSLGD
jgi:hypothetical protein